MLQDLLLVLNLKGREFELSKNNRYGEHIMNTKITTLAAISLAIGLGWVSQASATIYAGSRLNIQNLNIVPSDDTNTPFAGVTVNDWSFSVAGTARLNGNSTGGNISCSGNGVSVGNCGAGPRLGPQTNNAPGSVPVRGANDYSFFNPGPFAAAGDYGNSNAEITTAAVNGDAATSTIQITESELNMGLDAGSTSSIISNTGFSFSFSLSGGGGAGSMSVSFLADPDLLSFMSAAELGGTSVAAVDASFTLTQNTGGFGFVTWAPNGLLDGNCIAVGPACVEFADGDNLNREVSTNTPGTHDSSSDSRGNHTPDPGLVNFAINITGLADGDWTLALSAGTRTDVTRRVPEPEMLLLLAVGFIGFGAARVNRKKRAA